MNASAWAIVKGPGRNSVTRGSWFSSQKAGASSASQVRSSRRGVRITSIMSPRLASGLFDKTRHDIRLGHRQHVAALDQFQARARDLVGQGLAIGAPVED